MIFLDTNVVSETLRKAPDPAVVAWLTRFDAEIALPTIVIGEIAFGIRKIRPINVRIGWNKVCWNGAAVSPDVFSG